jgi:TonB family protein
MMGFHERLADWSAWVWPLIANHLWQATIISLLVAAAAMLLNRGTARSRYIMWLIASFKFALPSALFVFLASQIGIEFNPLFDSSNANAPAATALYQVVAPVAHSAQPQALSAESQRGHNEIYCALTGVWAIGAAAIFAVWRARRKRFSLLIRAGNVMTAGREIETLNRVRAWLQVKRPVKLIITPALIEPGVWRAWRPVVVLPAKIADDLTAAELEAVMMHEMVHVIRRDNLINSFQMFLCCLIWFHPFVWLIDRRLLAEREQACDERVLELGGASKVYASSLLKVFCFCMGGKLAGVSYATGSNLRRRIEHIMADNLDRRFTLGHRALIAAIATLAIGFSLAAGLFGYASATAQSKKGNIIEPGGPAGGVAGGVPGGIAGGVAGGIPGGIDGGIPGGVPGGVPGDMQYQLKEPPPPPPDPKALLDALEQAPEFSAQFKNRDDFPLTITGVKVRTAQVAGLSSDEKEGHSYQAAKIAVTVVNNTNRRIKGIKLLFANKETNYLLITDRMNLRIEPHATYTLGRSERNFMFYARQLGDPESIVVEIIGVRFEDGGVVGQDPRYPPPPPAKPEEPSANSASADSAPPASAPPAASTPAEPAPPAAPSEDAQPEGVTIIRKSGGVLQGAAVKRVEPVYPPLAKANQVSGAVAVEIVIDEEGNVVSARAISGHPLLMAAAVEAARQWQFTPATRSGVAVRVIGTLTFNFQL